MREKTVGSLKQLDKLVNDMLRSPRRRGPRKR